MGTGTSRPRTRPSPALALAPAAVALAFVAIACGLAACGGSSGSASQGGSTQMSRDGQAAPGQGAAGQARSGQAGSFSWLHPERPPAGWTVVRIPNGSHLGYPSSWMPQHSDRGSATAVLRRPDGAYLGYLNLTPRQGDETLADWSSFRPEHNRDEGDRAVRRLAAATGLHFLTGTGSCVKDAYTTETGARFVEIACLVAGARAQSVIVGAAPPGAWDRTAPVIERAIAGVQT